MPASPSAPGPSADPAEPRVELEGLLYALDRPPRRQGRRSVLTVRLAAGEPGPAFVDRVDLYAFKSRQTCAARVADAFGRQAGQILAHLAAILDAAERAQAQASAAPPEALSPERRAAATELLEAPDLLERAGAAMEGLGHVGEDVVKRLCYLVATSRLTERPLNALLLAPSGAGKSAVLEAVSALVPPEQVVPLARLTTNALYYMGPEALRHKLVVVDEYEGAGEADHSLRVLQSKGELRLSAPTQGRSETFVVQGPVSVMSGTTATSLDLQNTSRCLELALDASPAQTRRIQAAQCRAWSGRGRARVALELWRDAQRLLEPLPVVIRYAPRLRFPARTTTDRRLSGKVLGLVGAHALLHQRQRPRDRQGAIVAGLADYAAVHALLRPQVQEAVDGLSPSAARLYRALAAEPARQVTRREAAAALGATYNTAKRALAELVAQELLAAAAPGPPVRYRLLDAAALAPGAELVDPEDLA